MSYRELRNCAEMLRALDFPRQISVENFRNPNFPLISEILGWLVLRFDSNARIQSDIDTPQDRVIFIRTVAQLMATKASVKMNTKKLYQADGLAIQEILKALSLLYGVLLSDNTTNEEMQSTLPNLDIANNQSDMKEIRALASSITNKGAVIFDLLRSEITLRDQRNNVINRQLELQEVESAIKSAMKSVERENKDLQTSISNVDSDQANLETKIEKKQTALERSQKRLHTLKKVRPAFMDEYEKLEGDLKKQYALFMKKFVNLSYLEQQIEEQDKIEMERMMERESAKKSVEVLGQALTLSGFGKEEDSDDDLDDDDDDDDLDDDDLHLKEMDAIKVPRQANSSPKNNRKVYGSMTGEDESDSFDSSDDLGLEEETVQTRPNAPRPTGVKGKGSSRGQIQPVITDDHDNF